MLPLTDSSASSDRSADTAAAQPDGRDRRAPGLRRTVVAASMGEVVTVGLVLTALVLTMYAFGTERAGLRQDDAAYYFQMAESPDYLARLPYSFRVLSPLFASLWPGGPLTGFTVVTLVSLILAGVALHAYQRAIGLSVWASGAGAALFAVSGGAVRMLTTPVYVDAAAYLVEATALLSMATGRFWPFLAAVTVGVTNRETAVLLVPLYWAMTPRGLQTRTRSALMILLPLGTAAGVVLLKLWAGGVVDGSTPLTRLVPSERALRQELPPWTDLLDLFSAFGVLWLLALKNLPGSTPLQRRPLVFGALVILQLVVARGDEGRVLSHLFILVIPLAMVEVDRLLLSRARGRAHLAAFLVLACVASMVHARWTWLESTAIRYAIVAAGTTTALVLTVVAPRLYAPRSPGLTAAGSGDAT
jgi:hypothetical protein